MAGPTTDLDTLRRDISREIERLASEAGTKAINGAPANAEVDRIKELQAVLAALPRKESFPLRWAAMIGAVCLIGASLTWTIAIPRARVQLNLAAASIIVRLTDDFSWDGNWQVDPPVRLLQFTHLDLPPEYGIPEAVENQASLELNVTQGNLRVRHLFIAQGAWSTIASGVSGGTDIVVHGAPFRGDIDISGVVSARAGPALGTSLPSQTFDPETPPGRIGFQYDGRSALPAVLHVSLVDELRLREIPVSALSFFEERADGTQGSAFTSQIISGTMTMTDTGEQITLAPAAALRLTDAQGIVSTLKVTRKDIQVKFEGTASDVTFGTGDFARSLKPTILEWLFHQQKLGFFWGAITFLWGFAWSARKLYSGNM
jgi:hypothetical protein